MAAKWLLIGLIVVTAILSERANGMKTRLLLIWLGFFASIFALALLTGCSLKSQQISFVGVQSADLLSTHVAESRGAYEVNPLMSNEIARIAFKGVSTAFIVYATSKIAKEHQTTAKVVLITLNAVMSGIVLNNFRVASAHGGRDRMSLSTF